MYDLVSDAFDDYYARRVGGKRKLRREPLSGILDGANVVFMAPLFPILASPKVYLGTTLLTVTTDYSVDTDSGVFTFVNPPNVQPSADITVVPLTSSEIALYAWAGFNLMEAEWHRGYLLSSSSSVYAMAAYDSSHIYVVDGGVITGQAVSDPVTGASTFSASQTQRQVIARCTELAYLDSLLYEASLSDVDFAERVGGARVNASRRPTNIKQSRDVAMKQVEDSIMAAMMESDPSLTFLGARRSAPRSTEYSAIWAWEDTGSIGAMVPQLVGMPF